MAITRELAKRVMAAKGLNPDDKVLARAIALRIVLTLRLKVRRGQALEGSERRKGACVWRFKGAILIDGAN